MQFIGAAAVVTTGASGLGLASARALAQARLSELEEFASLALELGRDACFNGQAIRLDGAIRMPPR